MPKIKTILEKLVEEYKIPISIGDTVLMGKFKNKPVIIKSISISEKGDLLINGKSASRFRIKPQVKEEHPYDLPPDDKALEEKAPPGMEKVVKALKKKKDVKNAYATAWSMYNKKNELKECICLAKMYGDDMIIGKNRDRNYAPSLSVIRELHKNGTEIVHVIDNETDWSEGMNQHGIGLVNSALFVKRDEKEFDKSKKAKIKSKDGVRIREVLSKDNLIDAVKVAMEFQDGIKGHTLIGDGKKIISIENTSRLKPIIKVKDLKKEPLVRTNHGLEHPEAGYQGGNDKLSSELRLINTLNLLHKTKDYTKLFPAIYNHRQDKGPKYDLVRAQNKLWTSSQLLMNLNKKEVLLYLIPGAVKYSGIENRLPSNYKPTIKILVRKFEKTPDGKHDYYITTDKITEAGNPTHPNVPEAGQLWPFSETEAWAKHWEDKRMSAILHKSLEGMTTVNSITDNSTIEDTKGLERAGVSKQKWAGMYDKPKMLKGWTMVDNLDYKKYITSKHKIADDGPVELPTKGLVHTKKAKKND